MNTGSDNEVLTKRKSKKMFFIRHTRFTALFIFILVVMNVYL